MSKRLHNLDVILNWIRSDVLIRETPNNKNNNNNSWCSVSERRK